MLIQIHLLQNYAPSNLNRDDTGSPKDAIFGGVRRGRISSQCLKRSMRRSAVFEEAFRKASLLGFRTRRLPYLIEEELKRMGVEGAAVKAITERVPEIGRESTKARAEEEEAAEPDEEEAEKEVQSKQLIFVAPNELHALAEKLLAKYKELGPDKWKKAKIPDITKSLGKSRPKSVDVAMFGRMTTSEAFENVEASVQVAHALSTNALSQEFDYFTAVDDLSSEAGAGMIGDVEFNSSTYYKYLNIHWEQLLENLGGDAAVARQAVLALLEAAITAQPSGKQNTFAAYSLPDLVIVEVSPRNLPVSYVNAFLKPARVRGEQTLMDGSITQLLEYREKVNRKFGLIGEGACLCIPEANLLGLKELDTLADLSQWLGKQLPVEG